MNWYKTSQDNQKTLVLMRGAPGSGKSFLAKQLSEGGQIFSTDDFWEINGQYQFNPSLLGHAHSWNLKRAIEAMQKGITPIIIDNTNVTARDMRPYAEAAIKYNYKVEMKEPNTPWKFDVDELVKRNTHNVPRASIERMISRWQPNLTMEDLLKKEEPR